MRLEDVSPPATTIPQKQSEPILPTDISAVQEQDGSWSVTVHGQTYSVAATGGSTELPDLSNVYVGADDQLMFAPAGDATPVPISTPESATESTLPDPPADAAAISSESAEVEGAEVRTVSTQPDPPTFDA